MEEVRWVLLPLEMTCAQEGDFELRLKSKEQVMKVFGVVARPPPAFSGSPKQFEGLSDFQVGPAGLIAHECSTWTAIVGSEVEMVH